MDLSEIIQKRFKRGCFEEQNQFEKRRGYFFNIILLFIVVASLIMVFAANSWPSKLFNIAGVILFLTLYYLHGIKPKISVLLLGLVYQVFIFVHSSVLDVGGQVEYGALAMTIVLPIFYRRQVAFYFMITNVVIFYYPYFVLDAYQSFFKLSYVFAIGLFFTIRAFVKENEIHEQVLEKGQNELKDLNKHKNHLIQVVAHDLKSPLNQIDGLVNLIKLSNEGLIKNEEYLEKIEGSIDHMSNMITRILDVEKIENQEPVELKKLNLIPVLKTVIESFKELAANKDISIEQFIPVTNSWINGNTHYLYQIFHNLLSNAIKFSPRAKKVRIVIEQTKHTVNVQFIDQGPGISKEDQKKLFIKFQKLTAKPTNNEDSTGLGLALAKSFVEALSAKLVCESELGSGAIFSVEFNLSKSQ